MNRKDKLVSILKESDAPLNYARITELYNLGFEDKTSKEVVNSILSDEISTNLSESVFIRVDLGIYALRMWLNDNDKQYKEYIHTRKKIDYLDEYIAVIEKTKLSEFIDSYGVSVNEIDGDKLSRLSKPMHRRKAEATTDVVQLVSVFLISYKNKLLTFTRTNALPEKRLRSTISINFGGHISYSEANDIFNKFDISDPNSLISRELDEEISIKNSYEVDAVGYIYDNTTTIGLQHLGLFHHVKLSNTNFAISEKRFFINPSFKTTDSIRNDHDVDYWTHSLLNYFDNCS